jgi:hypothetical protein
MVPYAGAAANTGRILRALGKHGDEAVELARDVGKATRAGSHVAGQGFHSFSAFKRAMGPAGPGKEWHHIVEQGGDNVTKFGAETIHNTSNIVRVDASVHRQISAFYSSKPAFAGGQTVREWLRSQSFEQQAQFGLETLRRFGAVP